MRRSFGLAIILAAIAWAAPRVTRVSIAAMEKSFDQRVAAFSADDPFLLLGNTRGVYLEGYGAVFTTELNLVASATVSPFRPAFSKDEIAKVRKKKLQRVELLKQGMRDMLIASAASLDQVPSNEQIVFAVTLFYYHSWEDTTGLPGQILMQAERRALLDYQAGRIDRAALNQLIRVQEF